VGRALCLLGKKAAYWLSQIDQCSKFRLAIYELSTLGNLYNILNPSFVLVHKLVVGTNKLVSNWDQVYMDGTHVAEWRAGGRYSDQGDLSMDSDFLLWLLASLV
jgi:hypothetical protein